MVEAKDFTICIPTRNRFEYLRSIIDDIKNTISIPTIVIHDNNPCKKSVELTKQEKWITTIDLNTKHTMTKLWNQCIINSSTSYVINMNDDIRLKNNWFEMILKALNKHPEIKLLCLCQFHIYVLHKSLILDIGWFDERFTEMGQDDIDIIFRIAENNLSPAYNINHLKLAEHKFGPRLSGTKENVKFFTRKWATKDMYEGKGKNKRKLAEIDWYPEYTNQYERSFGYKKKEWCSFREFTDAFKNYYLSLVL